MRFRAFRILSYSSSCQFNDPVYQLTSHTAHLQCTVEASRRVENCNLRGRNFKTGCDPIQFHRDTAQCRRSRRRCRCIGAGGIRGESAIRKLPPRSRPAAPSTPKRMATNASEHHGSPLFSALYGRPPGYVRPGSQLDVEFNLFLEVIANRSAIMQTVQT